MDLNKCGVYLKNGYLLPSKEVEPSVEQVNAFKDELSKMKIFGMSDVRACGIPEQNKSSKVETANEELVDIVYASAVPLSQLYIGFEASDNFKEIAFMTLCAQYTGALRLASQRSPCDVYLMLLGGGVFANSKDVILNAIKVARTKVKTPDVTIRIIDKSND